MSSFNSAGPYFSAREFVSAVEAHAAGEEGRVIIGGVIDIPGTSMYEKMRHLEQHRDDLRLRMLREPRGYPVTCCNLVLPSNDPAAAAGFIIMQQTEYPLMSGSNTMCVAAVLLKLGMIPATEPVTDFNLEAPAGLIGVRAEVAGGRVGEIVVRNQPALAIKLDAPIELAGIGTVHVDIAYGGMLFAICRAADLGFALRSDEGQDLARVGQELKKAVNEQITVVHPANPRITEVTATQLYAPAVSPNADLRNTVILSAAIPSAGSALSGGGILDRSPCGTGTCAKMAVLDARGELPIGRDFVHESIIGTTFRGRAIERVKVGGSPAIIPEIGGRASITGFTTYCLEDDDPFPEGFTVGDIWGQS